MTAIRRISPQETKTRFQNSTATQLTETIHFRLEFAIDVASDKYFFDKSESRASWRDIGARMSVKLPGVISTNERVIITPDSCLHFDPKQAPGVYEVLPDHPEARNKRAAYRDAPESELGRVFLTAPDPRRYYGRGPGMHFWETLDHAIAASQRNNGHVIGARLYEANDSNGIWYRQDEIMGNNYVRTIWSSKAGFQPIHNQIWLGGFQKELVYRLVWEWESVAGIFVPTMTKESMYNPTLGELDHSLELRFERSILNDPIDATQFTYAGLGLKDGDLVLDRADNICFVMKNGNPVKLANFHERYVGGLGGMLTRWRLVGLSLLVFSVIATAILIRRRRTKGLAGPNATEEDG